MENTTRYQLLSQDFTPGDPQCQLVVYDNEAEETDRTTAQALFNDDNKLADFSVRDKKLISYIYGWESNQSLLNKKFVVSCDETHLNLKND
ncbi:MAG: hypothetical protein KIT27_06895 [Legionellales bacterium]|nr:hypothetical protein [Legionellales bacterium]